MLEKILQQLDSTNDLLQCRLVNRLWESLASPKCRRNRVEVAFGTKVETDSAMEHFFTVFSETENLTWSALSFPKGGGESIAIFTKRVVESFGNYLRNLRMDITHGNLTQLLQLTPNLRHLVLLGIQNQQPVTGEEINMQLPLGNLKRLELDSLVGHNLDLFEIIRKSSNSLDYIHVDAEMDSEDASGTSPAVAQRIGTLLIGVRYVSLKISVPSPIEDIFNVLASKDINLRKLDLTVSEIGPEDNEEEYEVAERLILAHHTHLEILKVRVTDDPNPRPFDFPTLPALTFFHIIFNGDDDLFHATEWTSEACSSFLSQLETNQFPALTRVRIDQDHVCLGENITFPESSHFDSVTHLQLKTWSPIRRDWSQIFPNLLTIEAQIEISGKGRDYLEQIFLNKKLENLDLKLSLMYPCEELNLNSVLSGLQDSEALWTCSVDDPQYRALTANRRPSLLYLTGNQNSRYYDGNLILN